MSTTVSKEDVKDSCPAFKEGCPYAKLTEELFMTELKKCPAFKDGCPFKDSKSIGDIKNEMIKMPESKHHEGASHQQLLHMLQSVHQLSKEIEKEKGKCPVFETQSGGCPFKSASQEGKLVIEPPSAVLSTADLAKLKELCPAFKEGCPFANLDNEVLMKEIKKCPEFKDGCAFKNAHSIEEIYHKLEQMPNTGEDCHHRDILLETMKIIHGTHHDKASECPVLEKLGCPFKEVQSGGKPLIEPSESVLPKDGNSTASPEDLKHVDLTTLRETCPAFDKGCPFAQIGELPQGIKDCPEFKHGCPFKDMGTMAEVYEKLSAIPAFTGSDSHGAKLLQTLKEVHTLSKDLKEEMGECPVFANDGCPFKTICSDGRPLIEKLEFRKWTEVLQMSVQSDLMEAAGGVADVEPSLKLSKELKKGTKLVHREAENVHFIKDFIKGRIQNYWYRVLLADLYYVYKTLEEMSRQNKDHPYFKAIHFPSELERTDAIKQDLEFYYGEDWEEQIELSPATKEYVDRLKKIGDEDPVLLIPHHYTRYLGDLSGGLILKKLATKAMNLPSTGEGVRFFSFDNVSEPKKFKNHYRSQLDTIQINQEMSDKIVEEANLAFLLNIKIFKEIDVKAGYVEEETAVKKPKPKADDTVEQPAPASQNPDICPFATMAKTAGKQQEQAHPHVPTQSPAAESSSFNPVMVALLVAALAVFMALFFFKK
ncbi:hypothetical protein QZH41_011954 [Actinostola sp. cb2023]|nr:hypothetical protein QZH41_011954 [Actinostola sp. cb2023]